MDATASPFQVLALDGGGIRGIFTAALLAGLEADLGRPVTEHFDLIVGTSTGGIIALGLGAGLRPVEILDAYVQHRDQIFPTGGSWLGARRLVRSRYSPAGLRTVLDDIFGDRILGDSQVPLVIPAYNLGENDVYLFKTPHHPRLRRDWRVRMSSVAEATSAAPTYFPAFDLPNERVRLVDGGVWANNPALVGVAEAVSLFGHDLRDIRLLNIGTTSSPGARGRRLDRGGILQWLRSPSLIEVLLHAQGVGAFTQAQHLLGSANAKRLNPPLNDAEVSLDRVDTAALLAKAAHHSRQFSPEFEAVFGAHHRGEYQPFHSAEL